jgi:hypothetical protein
LFGSCRVGLVSAAILAAAVAFAPDAAAFEREWHVGGKLGGAALKGAPLGLAVNVHGAYGLSDMFDAVIEVTASRHGWSNGTDVFSASAGLAYKIDVLEWIPYVGLLAGYYHYAGMPGPNGEHGPEFGAAISAGVDYLVSREFVLGVDLRAHMSFEDGFSFPYYTGLLGAEYRWGW